MTWQKSPDALVRTFEHTLPMVAGVERRPMFGYPCAFVNGHLFCGLHGDAILVRLPEARRAELLGEGGRIFEPAPGKPMNDYVLAPAELVAEPGRLHALLSEALEHASSLGPKPEPKPAPSRKPRPATTPARKAPAKAKKPTKAKKKVAPPAKKAARAGRARSAKPPSPRKAAPRKTPAKKQPKRKAQQQKKQQKKQKAPVPKRRSARAAR